MSKRLVGPPAVAFGPMSSAMYMTMQMMAMQNSNDPNAQLEYPKDLTLEINGNHPTIVNLNEMRKKNINEAAEISKVFLDQVLLNNNVPLDISDANEKWRGTINKFLDESLRTHEEPEVIILETEEEETQVNKSESILKQAKEVTGQKGDKKIKIEKLVTEDDFKK